MLPVFLRKVLKGGNYIGLNSCILASYYSMRRRKGILNVKSCYM